MNGVVLSEGWTRGPHKTPREETVKERRINAFPNDEEWIRFFIRAPTWKSGRWRALIYNLNKRVVDVVDGKTVCCFQPGSSKTIPPLPPPTPFPSFLFFIPWKRNASLFRAGYQRGGGEKKEAWNNFFTRWYTIYVRNVTGNVAKRKTGRIFLSISSFWARNIVSDRVCTEIGAEEGGEYIVLSWPSFILCSKIAKIFDVSGRERGAVSRG